jgi:hypothetical protein
MKVGGGGLARRDVHVCLRARPLDPGARWLARRVAVLSYNPLMRRRWKALVVVGAVALFAALLFLLPPRDDGFDWIRKYGPKETASYPFVAASNRVERGGKVIEFRFAKFPKQFLRELSNRYAFKGESSFRDASAQMFLIDSQQSTVEIYFIRSSWLDEKLTGLQRAIGWSSS